MKKVYCLITALILLSFVLAGLFLSVAPDTVPVHFGVDGNVDRWGSKYEFLILPGCALICGVVTLVTSKFVPKKEKQNEKVVGITAIWLLILVNGLFAFFMVKALQGTTTMEHMPMKWVALAVFAVFIPLGDLMPKVKRGGMIGFRTPWSTANDVCWQKSQRFAGFCLVGSGVIGLTVTAVAPASWSIFILIGMMVITTIAGMVGSYRIYKKCSV